jgi:hypothetical protein
MKIAQRIQWLEHRWFMIAYKWIPYSRFFRTLGLLLLPVMLVGNWFMMLIFDDDDPFDDIKPYAVGSISSIISTALSWYFGLRWYWVISAPVWSSIAEVVLWAIVPALGEWVKRTDKKISLK